MILFILCAIVVAVIMSHAPFGVAVRMIGSNEKATRYSGVATDWMLVGVYVVSSLLCWVATVVMMARFNSARAAPWLPKVIGSEGVLPRPKALNDAKRETNG